MKVFLILYVIVSGIDLPSTEPLIEKIAVDTPWSFDTMEQCNAKKALMDVPVGDVFVKYELSCEVIE